MTPDIPIRHGHRPTTTVKPDTDEIAQPLDLHNTALASRPLDSLVDGVDRTGPLLGCANSTIGTPS